MMIYVFDLDNTLCDTKKKEDGNWDYLNAEPFNNRIKVVNDLYEKGNYIIIETARGCVSKKNWPPGLVVQDAGNTRYDLGPAALKLGLASLAKLDAVKTARERLPALLEQVGHHTLALAVWGNHGPTIVHWEESRLAVTVNLRLGDVMPLLSSATGRCFAAHAHPEAIAAMLQHELAQARQLARNDLPQTPEAVQVLLAEVRARGLARVVDTLLPGIVAFGAPVFDADRHMVLGLVVLGSAATLDRAWDGVAACALRSAALQLSSDLGYRV